MARDASIVLRFAFGAFTSILILAAACFQPVAMAGDRAPFASMYSDQRPFLDAIAREKTGSVARLRVTGISVPHHLLAADLIARGFRAAAARSYGRVVILSPDHFHRSRRPMATTPRDIDTVFGPLTNDRAVTESLLADAELFDDSDLFASEHGVAALLPFVRHFFPDAKIVPVAISYDASQADCDRLVQALGRFVDADTLVVQSTDYSHYLPADVAQRRDQETLNIIAAGDSAAVMHLLQSGHIDSKAAQYGQMRLQKDYIGSFATVIANRNSVEYGGAGRRTTSYIVTVYTDRPPAHGDLTYPDQTAVFFGGDIFIGRWFTAPLADKETANAIVQRIKAITGGAPLIANLEGVVLDQPPEGLGSSLHTMHASLAVPILRALNLRVASLANNHSGDLGPVGIEESLSILTRAGIVPLGHKEVVDVGPFRLVGLNFIGKLNYPDYAAMKPDEIESLCDIEAKPPLIALVHWGTEFTGRARPAEDSAARAMNACGIGAIVGAHSHQASARIAAPQGGEYQLTYSLGNLLFDQNAGSGALLELRAFKQGTYATRLIPVPNLFSYGTEQLRSKQGLSITAPQTNSARNRAD